MWTERRGYVLRCRMSNETSSEISGLRYSLTAIDAGSGSQPIANRIEGFGLPAYGMKTITFVTPIKFKPKEGNRLVLMLEQVLECRSDLGSHQGERRTRSLR